MRMDRGANPTVNQRLVWGLSFQSPPDFVAQFFLQYLKLILFIIFSSLGVVRPMDYNTNCLQRSLCFLLLAMSLNYDKINNNSDTAKQSYQIRHDNFFSEGNNLLKFWEVTFKSFFVLFFQANGQSTKSRCYPKQCIQCPKRLQARTSPQVYHGHRWLPRCRLGQRSSAGPSGWITSIGNTLEVQSGLRKMITYYWIGKRIKTKGGWGLVERCVG